MRWHVFSSYKYYATAAVALVGISAASTLLTDRLTLAQQPSVTATIRLNEDGDEADKLELAEKILTETLSDDHPKLKEVRKRLEQARVQYKKAAEAASKADAAAKRSIVPGAPGVPSVVRNLQQIPLPDGNVVTEEIHGDHSVVVRRTADGNVTSELLAASPKEFRALSLATLPKQNSELQKAVEKYKAKDASDQDKSAAKEKMVSILGEQFDEDMEQRSKQIAELEKKLVTLKEQIQKRKDAKSRLIDLRIELLMNESEGLGFPSGWQQSSGPVIRTLTVPAAPIPPMPPVSPLAK